MAWKLKGCPRCQGDTYIHKGEYNIWYEGCLQCGYEGELKSLTPVTRSDKQPEPEKEKVYSAG